MINDLDETIKDILLKHGKLNATDVDIAFDQPTSEWAASLTRPTINLYLYDLRENLELRNTTPRVERGRDSIGRKYVPPKRIDLSYLITVWARNPEDEHQLLWRVLHTLSRFSMISPESSIGSVKNQPVELRTKVALPSEAVRNMPDLWGVMENQLKPSINFQVTVALDTEEVIEAPLVLTFSTRFGQKQLGDGEALSTHDMTIFHIGGQVLVNNTPVGTGAQVTLLSRGDIVMTDADGRYVFSHVIAGDHTVEVVVEGRTPQEFQITVPSAHYNFLL